MTKERILVFDALNLFLRNFLIVPEMDPNGAHVGGVIGSLRSIKSAMRDVRPTRVIMAWDGKGGSVRRRGMFEGYKDRRRIRPNREFGNMGDVSERQSMHVQLDKLKVLLGLLGVTQIEVENIEADDVIGYLCRSVYRETDKVIVSTDRDFLQLIDGHTLVYSPVKKVLYTSKTMHEETGILPENFVYFRAIQGSSDASDNIEGVKGIGKKFALKLFPFLGERSVELSEIFAHAEANRDKSPKYRLVIEKKTDIARNVQLMQLTVPIISPTSIRAIGHALTQPVGLNLSEFKLRIMRDGMLVSDSDVFSTFNDLKARAEAVA